MYRVELRDAYGNAVESKTTDSPAEAETVLRDFGARLIANDDERFDGPGAFQAGSLHWFKEEPVKRVTASIGCAHCGSYDHTADACPRPDLEV